MNVQRHPVQSEVEVTRRDLKLLRGSKTHSARAAVTKRDGRIRLMRDSGHRISGLADEVKVQRAHERLRLPSLERWLSGRLW